MNFKVKWNEWEEKKKFISRTCCNYSRGSKLNEKEKNGEKKYHVCHVDFRNYHKHDKSVVKQVGSGISNTKSYKIKQNKNAFWKNWNCSANKEFDENREEV